MNEEELEPKELAPAPINVARASTPELHKTAISSKNSTTMTKEMLNRDKKYIVTINSTEKDKGAVKVGINGYIYNIPRDKPVTVPYSVVKALEEAKIKEYHVKLDFKGGDKPAITSQEVSRFGFSSAPAPEPEKAEGKKA